MLHEHFLRAMGGLVTARQELESYKLLARYNHSANGALPMRVGDRWGYIPNAASMVEATFRLMKYIQHGGPSSLTDAAALWGQAAQELSLLLPPEDDLVGEIPIRLGLSG